MFSLVKYAPLLGMASSTFLPDTVTSSIRSNSTFALHYDNLASVGMPRTTIVTKIALFYYISYNGKDNLLPKVTELVIHDGDSVYESVATFCGDMGFDVPKAIPFTIKSQYPKAFVAQSSTNIDGSIASTTATAENNGRRCLFDLTGTLSSIVYGIDYAPSRQRALTTKADYITDLSLFMRILAQKRDYYRFLQLGCSSTDDYRDVNSVFRVFSMVAGQRSCVTADDSPSTQPGALGSVKRHDYFFRDNDLPYELVLVHGVGDGMPSRDADTVSVTTASSVACVVCSTLRFR
jgi:hypothetical protein